MVTESATFGLTAAYAPPAPAASAISRSLKSGLVRARISPVNSGAGRSYNVNDDTQLKMGDYFDLAANLYGLPKPPRLPRALAQEQLPVMQLSFMSESRRMDNSRMKLELRLTLRYPSVIDGLAAIPRQGRDA